VKRPIRIGPVTYERLSLRVRFALFIAPELKHEIAYFAEQARMLDIVKSIYPNRYR
jgi:hypothetical protein